MHSQTVVLEQPSVVSAPDHFAVIPGHEDLGSQEVVSRSGRYVVVTKRELQAVD